MLALLRETTVSTLLVLATCLFAGSNEVTAKSTEERALIVVANTSDAECVQRIGREHVQVKPLFAPEVGARLTNYAACNLRVRQLVAFRVYLFRADTSCPGEEFWRERLSQANPEGLVRRLSHPRWKAASDDGHRVRQVFEVHRVLTSTLPEYREAFDAQLEAELQRLRWLRQSPPQLAANE